MRTWSACDVGVPIVVVMEGQPPRKLARLRDRLGAWADRRDLERERARDDRGRKISTCYRGPDDQLEVLGSGRSHPVRGGDDDLIDAVRPRQGCARDGCGTARRDVEVEAG